MHKKTKTRTPGELATRLAGVLLLAGLTGCASGAPDKGGPLKKTVDVIATAAVQSLSDSNIQNAWQDGSGMWHWIKVKPGFGTYQCEGRRVGVPAQCDQIGPP